MPAKIKSPIKSIPFNMIEIDPFFTPKALEISKHLEPDKNLTLLHLKLTEDTGYREPLRVGFIDGKYYLLAGYECWLSYRALLHGNPDEKITCIVIKGKSKAQLIEIAVRLSKIESKDETYLNRLINLDKFISEKIPMSSIKNTYGVTYSSKTNARMLQRDLQLVKHKPILNLVIGFNDADNTSPCGFLEKILQTNMATNAKISYGTALEVIKTIGDEPVLIEKFVAEYEKEIDSLRDHHTTPDEEVKPVYTWRNYRPKKILKIAEAIKYGGSYEHDENEKDFFWNVSNNEQSGNYKIPEVSFNLFESDLKNIKILQEVKFVSKIIGETLAAHIARIRPASHGGWLKVEDLNSNLPKIDSLKYIEDIRDNKMLTFCNRQRLVKVLGLHAGNFGFDTNRSDSVSTYKEAWTQYSHWYNNSFLPDVRLHYQNDPRKNPKFSYHISILEWLRPMAENEESVQWSPFFNNLFAGVFEDTGLRRKARQERIEMYLDSQRDFVSHAWDEIKLRLSGSENGQIVLTGHEIVILMKEVADSEAVKLQAVAAKIDRSVGRLIELSSPQSTEE